MRPIVWYEVGWLRAKTLSVRQPDIPTPPGEFDTL